ncbi:uncharacterized protein LOC111051886 [Nilaparvata lugens]|uniref:uncharacterized protein LOC111051886 n=1 Tax=Nilaparvata lugens TaxID=108931 RepID=UPI00193CE042|nr:uncharacterized protein LOC111051886 [Nilaparvata lugens]XP_039283187.1 uncharacterized protein LOC111051886 [Nilaparvata lugens]XP_039283188.1 uncharacterized protein LOC111051886 [Nilaparvata lugens]
MISNSSKMAPHHVCELCEKTFATAFTLRRHCIRKHASVFPRRQLPRFSYKCGICSKDIGSSSFPRFVYHLNENHDITVEREELEFNCQEDFEIWRKSVEKRSYFVKYRQNYIMDSSNAVKSYFRCNRSGIYKGETSPTKRKRHLKSQGSSKIGSFCPAGIRATTYKNGKISVEFIKTHVGHDLELAHIPLPIEDKQQLASKIAQKIPFDTIIDDLHASVGDELERKHLVTKEVLRNIIKEYSLDKECVRHPDDTLSIEAWVEKMKGSENNCIILYKPCGIVSPDLPQLKKQDFVLGIMTEAHSEKLKKYGGDFICIASNHGTNAYQFEMSTILVLDDLRQGFPCAFYFSNRNDNLGFELFLSNVRNRIGMINTRTLMTDMPDVFYNSWQNVMGLVEQRLYSTWHVQKEWQKRINTFKNKTKKEEVSKKLFSLHFEKDERTFEMTLSATINDLKSDKDTFTFSKYFEEHFLKNPQLWAYCYRKNVGFNTNMHLERLHGIFKKYI